MYNLIGLATNFSIFFIWLLWLNGLFYNFLNKLKRFYKFIIVFAGITRKPSSLFEKHVAVAHAIL